MLWGTAVVIAAALAALSPAVSGQATCENPVTAFWGGREFCDGTDVESTRVCTVPRANGENPPSMFQVRYLVATALEQAACDLALNSICGEVAGVRKNTTCLASCDVNHLSLRILRMSRCSSCTPAGYSNEALSSSGFTPLCCSAATDWYEAVCEDYDEALVNQAVSKWANVNGCTAFGEQCIEFAVNDLVAPSGGASLAGPLVLVILAAALALAVW